MAIRQSDAVEVKRVKGKGRGVFARRAIRKGEVFETCPVLVVPAAAIEDYSTGFGPYVFEWGEGKVALVLGLRLAVQPLVPAQRPLRGRGPADQALPRLAGHRAGRGDHRQLQRRAGPEE